MISVWVLSTQNESTLSPMLKESWRWMKELCREVGLLPFACCCSAHFSLSSSDDRSELSKDRRMIGVWTFSFQQETIS